MLIKYVDGPDKIRMGIAGEFRRGEAREVPNDLAQRLLKKTSIKFVVESNAKTQRRKDSTTQ